MIAALHVLLAGFLSLTGAEPVTPGVTVRIWNVGESMHDIHQIEPGQLPNVVAVLPTLDLVGRKDFLEHDRDFILLADGEIIIDQPGVYDFQLTSDDGSELWIGGKQVIDHGGLHSAEAAEGRIVLEIGTHPFQVKYFQATGDSVLKLAWKPPLASRYTVIPESVLQTKLSVDLPTSTGRKSIVRPKLPRHPGHGVPLSGLHPALEVNSHLVGDLDGHVMGMAWASDGQLLMLTDAGSLWAVELPTRRHDSVRLTRIAGGLDDPGGLVVADDGIWVIQREELTRLKDLDGDGMIDEYRAIATGWPVEGQDAGPARGLIASGNDFLTMLGRRVDDNGLPAGSEHRGTVLQLSRDGSWEIVASGLVAPEGFVHGDDSGIAIIDQAAFGGIVPLQPGQPSLAGHGIKLPRDASPTAASWIPSGPWKGQVLVAGGDGQGLRRLQFDQHDGGVQGVVFRASQGFGHGIDHIAVDNEGVAWVLGRDDRGTHLHAVSKIGTTAFEMESIEAHANGLEVTFTHPVDPLVASDPSSWILSASSMSGYGDSAPVRLAVDRASVHVDDRTISLEVDDLPAAAVLHLQLAGPWSSQSGDLLHSNEAWYTMHRVPTRRMTSSSSSRVHAANMLTPRQEAEGWSLLFDGKNMDAWRGFNKDHLPEGWSIVEESIVRTGPGGDIITREQFDDFELSLDWQVAPGGNSGIFFNVTEDGHSVWLTGPEMQVLDNARHHDGRNPLTSAGSDYALHAPSLDMTGPPGTWNRAQIVVRGDEVEYWLNGVRIVDYVLQSPEWERRVADSKFSGMPDYGRRSMGHIAIQDHGDVVAFRNIRIRRLDDHEGVDDP